MTPTIVRALACDYDGTAASADRIGSVALDALERARKAEIRLVLVTGRAFFELTRVCERLDLFDAVVAENGGVLYYPSRGLVLDQGPAPAPRLLAELDRRGIAYGLGRVVVGVARADEHRVREALDAVGVELDLVPNRASLMLLPAGLGKGTGVRRVIRDLGLSFHDVLGLGDAENDFELFDECGFTACPANAIQALKERADWIFRGENGGGVAEAIDAWVLGPGPPVAALWRHRIELGWASETAEPIAIPARGANVLIHGDPAAGKSWLAGALVERLVARRYATCVIDPEGDYQVLARLPEVSWAGIGDERALQRALGAFERDPAACVVLDLSGQEHTRKVRLTEAALARVQALRAAVGRPHWVVVDEAHYSLHAGGVAETALAMDAKGFCIVTYRPSWLRPSVLASLDVAVLARTANAGELAFLRSALAGAAWDAERAVAVLPDLPRGEFLALERDQPGAGGPVTFAAAPRATLHVRHRRKYGDLAVPAAKRFLFRRPGQGVVASADSLAAFRGVVGAADPATLAFHAERGDFSRWVLDVFGDRELGQHFRKVEARWRRGEVENLREAFAPLVSARYGGAS